MKNELPLNKEELSHLYWELARRGAFCSGEKFSWRFNHMTEEELLTLAVLQSRYDPRLLIILVDFFKLPRDLHPIHFKRFLRQEEALPIMAVIGEFVLESPASLEAKELCRFLMTGTRPVPTQLFYRGLYPIAGKKMREVIERPLWAFKKWGFLAADPPLLKEKAGPRIYLFDQPTRLRILQELAARQKRFRLKDYLTEIRDSISRQQALKDLSSVRWLRKRGRGKGTFYALSDTYVTDRDSSLHS